jgi:hypothetical protein
MRPVILVDTVSAMGPMTSMSSMSYMTPVSSVSLMISRVQLQIPGSAMSYFLLYISWNVTTVLD